MAVSEVRESCGANEGNGTTSDGEETTKSQDLIG